MTVGEERPEQGAEASLPDPGAGDGAAASAPPPPAAEEALPPPADGAAAPTDGAAAPTDGAAAPTEGAAAPSEGAAPEAEGVAAPSEGAAPEAGGVAAPSEGVAAPSDGAAASTEGVAAPSEGAAPGSPEPAPESADPAAPVLARAEEEARAASESGSFQGTETQKTKRADIGLDGAPAERSPLLQVRIAGETARMVREAERIEDPIRTPVRGLPALTAPPSAPADEKAPAEAAKTDASAPPVAPSTNARASTARLKARTEEDDRLVAALIFLAGPPPPGAPMAAPSPFATVGGVSLLKRAAASCKLAQVPRVLLAGDGEPEQVQKIKAELVLGGWDGPVELWNGSGAPPWGEKGRLLILDASGVHDPEAVARLAKWKGDRAYVLVATEGDGMRVQIEGNRVREVGTQLVPFDGVTCGALSVPVGLFPRLSENGALSALIALAGDGLLGAAIERRTFAREIGSESGLSEARRRLGERAAGGPHDTFLNRLLVKRISAPITQMLLPLGVSPAALGVASLVVGLAGSALFTGGGQPPGALPLLLAPILIIVSTVFDCTAYELRSFAIRPGAGSSRLEVIPHGLVAIAALAALGYGGQLLGAEGGFMHGLVAAGGAAIATVLLMLARSPADEAAESTDPATMGIELLARRFMNREIAWVLLALVVAHLVATRILRSPAFDEGPPPHEILDHGLVGLAALTHSFWVALAFFLALKPRKA